MAGQSIRDMGLRVIVGPDAVSVMSLERQTARVPK